MLRFYQFFFNNYTQEGILFNVFNVGVSGSSVSGSFLPLLILAFLWIAAAYFIGSLNFSIIISRLVYHDDVRKHGSSNAGSTNMQRTYGNKAGVVTLICDMAKGIVAVLIARVLFGENVAYLSGLACMIGHCFPCYFSFKGGKGVATAAAVILALNPLVFLLLVAIFLILVLGSKYISLGSVMAGLLFPVILDRYYAVLAASTDLEYSSPTLAMTICSIAFAVIIIVRHRSNIKKLLNGTENKISLKGKKSKESRSDTPSEVKSLHNIDSEEQ